MYNKYNRDTTHRFTRCVTLKYITVEWCTGLTRYSCNEAKQSANVKISATHVTQWLAHYATSAAYEWLHNGIHTIIKIQIMFNNFTENVQWKKETKIYQISQRYSWVNVHYNNTKCCLTKIALQWCEAVGLVPGRTSSLQTARLQKLPKVSFWLTRPNPHLMLLVSSTLCLVLWRYQLGIGKDTHLKKYQRFPWKTLKVQLIQANVEKTIKTEVSVCPSSTIIN